MGNHPSYITAGLANVFIKVWKFLEFLLRGVLRFSFLWYSAIKERLSRTIFRLAELRHHGFSYVLCVLEPQTIDIWMTHTHSHTSTHQQRSVCLESERPQLTVCQSDWHKKTDVHTCLVDFLLFSDTHTHTHFFPVYPPHASRVCGHRVLQWRAGDHSQAFTSVAESHVTIWLKWELKRSKFLWLHWAVSSKQTERMLSGGSTFMFAACWCWADGFWVTYTTVCSKQTFYHSTYLWWNADGKSK